MQTQRTKGTKAHREARSLAAATRPLRHLLRTDGTISVELALTLGLIATMIIPMTDIGMGAYTQMQVQNATQAGAEFATVNGFNATNITTAVTSATSLSGISASPTPSESCGCVVSGAITAATCGSTCASSGDPAGTFVTVSGKATYTTLFDYPGIASPMNLTAQAVVRIK